MSAEDEGRHVVTCANCGKEAGGWDERQGWTQVSPWQDKEGKHLDSALLCPECVDAGLGWQPG
jgi:hypothetical protein